MNLSSTRHDGRGASIYIHETVTCRSLQTRTRYQELAMSLPGFAKLGSWQVMGMTGQWPTVVNIVEIPGGIDGWVSFAAAYGSPAHSNTVPYDELDAVRSAGEDRLMRPTPWSPTTQQLVADGVKAPLFIHERTSVRPGTAFDYLSAMEEQWRPIAEELGHRCSGMFEVITSDTEVVTLWATTPEGHAAMLKARDQRIEAWNRTATTWATSRRWELLIPSRGTPLAPAV